MDVLPTPEDFAAAFGLTVDDPSTAQDPPAQDPEPSTDDPDTNTGDPVDNQNTGDGGEGDTGTDDGTPTPPPQNQQNNNAAQRKATQANQAFARMRTDNAAMLKTLQQTATILGIDPKLPPDQLSRLIQQKATEAQAKRNNIDPSIMQRLNQLEEVNARYQAQEREKILTNDFNLIKTKFGATDDDLMAFAQALDNDNYDPFAQGANNLVTEFISRNFDKIIQNKVDAAVRAEQERAAKGSGASTPQQKQGQDNNKEQKISTQADFDAFMNSLTNN